MSPSNAFNSDLMISARGSRRRRWIWLVLPLFLLSGLFQTGCQGTPIPLSGELTLEEHPLESPPDPDRGLFQPVGTTQEAVLESHQEERSRLVVNLVSDENYQPVMYSQGDGVELTAVLKESPQGPPRMTVDLLQGEELIFSADAGLPSPALPLQSLWSFEGHWALEILLADAEIWQGQLYRDGVLINQILGYEDIFGFQLLAGKPFYFFQKGSMLGYSYDGLEYELPYEQIPHFGCCSASTLNPLPAENMVAFYAQAGEDWFYLELGKFNQ